MKNKIDFEKNFRYFMCLRCGQMYISDEWKENILYGVQVKSINCEGSEKDRHLEAAIEMKDV